MPQLSMDEAMTVTRLEVTLRLDELQGVTYLQLIAKRHDGNIIAATGVHLAGFEECDLLPATLAEVAYGWLYADAKACTLEPAKTLRSTLKEIRQRGATSR